MRAVCKLCAVTAATGCLAASSVGAQVVREELSGVRNYARVESTVACAGAITPAVIPKIRELGYKSIINLRLASEPGADVEVHTTAAKTAGIQYFHVPFSAAKPDPAAVDAFLKVITRPDVSPAFIH